MDKIEDIANNGFHSESLEDDNVRKVKEFFKKPGLFKKVLKKQEIQIVETSSEKNVNIEATFRLIASLVDKRRTKENKNPHKVPEIKNYRGTHFLHLLLVMQLYTRTFYENFFAKKKFCPKDVLMKQTLFIIFNAFFFSS